MTFDEVLKQVQQLLERQGRVSYRALKRRFELDDDYIEDLREEIVEAKQIAIDENGKVLVWVGRSHSQAQAQAQATQSPHTAVSAPHPPPMPAPPSQAERRQLTVMFCDLVGSTALSERLDPEDLREVIQSYQHACAAVINHYEGRIAQYLGDGLLIYFGYPTSHEDDAVRAVRSGLEIVAALHELNTRLVYPIQVRIGIHTGQVVVGEMGGEDRHEQLAIGDTPNIAARVQDTAEPDTVYISAATYQLIEGLFNCTHHGPQELRGLSAPVVLYRAIAPSVAESRFDVAVHKGLSPLVGRDQEFDQLEARWEQAIKGHGQAVLLSGEPGIGKSRLVQALKERVTQDGTSPVVFRCLPYHQNSALYPVIESLQRALGVDRTASPETKRQKLEEMLSQYDFPQVETGPLLTGLLSLPHPDQAQLTALSPQVQKQKTFESLVSWQLEIAAQQPLLCIWEDLHWADPSTLEFLSVCLDHIPTTRILALCVFRPEFRPPWERRSYISQLTLNRLGRRPVAQIIERITSDRPLPSEVVEQIIAKTDGVPLFVEELTKMLVESEALQVVNDRYKLPIPLETMTIPSTLHDSLMARLDRLGQAKERAQLGATIGREFSYDLLQAIAPVKAETLQQELQQLVNAELIYQRGKPPHARYFFKHALVQDIAYQSLLRTTRQQYHQKIAQALDEAFPEVVETQPELLAQHYTEAGQGQEAIAYWHKAGQRARQRSAYLEATNHLTRGLEVLATLPDTLERAQQELSLLTTLGASLIIIKSPTAPEVKHTYARARALCQQVEDFSQLSRVLFAQWAAHTSGAEHQAAQTIGTQLLEVAQQTENPTALLVAHHTLGCTLFWQGAFSQARQHLEHPLATTTVQPQNAAAAAITTRITTSSYAGVNLWCLGYPDQALKRSCEALNLARELAHPYSIGYVSHYLVTLHMWRGEAQAALEQSEAELSLAREHGFALWLAGGSLGQGAARAAQGQTHEGIDQLRQGMDAWQATGTETAMPMFLAWLAAAYGREKQAEEGLRLLAEALEIVDKTKEHYYEAELYRLKGELLLLQAGVTPRPPAHDNREEAAEACFQRALDIARRQSAKSLELRASMSLARLWNQQDQQPAARHLLAELYDWFTEGFETKDLQDAQTLLTELTQETIEGTHLLEPSH